MATFLHTMVRVTDPERSRRFYEALGLRYSRDLDVVLAASWRRRTTSSHSATPRTCSS